MVLALLGTTLRSYGRHGRFKTSHETRLPDHNLNGSSVRCNDLLLEGFVHWGLVLATSAAVLLDLLYWIQRTVVLHPDPAH